MNNIFKRKKMRHVGRPTSEKVSKAKKIKFVKILSVLVFTVLIGGLGIYLYIYRDFIDFSSITGNSSTYSSYEHAIQNGNSVPLVTFNPDTKKKVGGSLYFLEYNHPNGIAIFDYFFQKSGFAKGNYNIYSTEVYYNGNLIKTFSKSQKYFYVKSNWAGRTLVLKLNSRVSSNQKVSRYLRIHIPKILKHETVKINNKHYYLINNSRSYYNNIKNNKYYIKADSSIKNSFRYNSNGEIVGSNDLVGPAIDRLAVSYASQIKRNIFYEEWNYVKGKKNNKVSQAVMYNYGNDNKQKVLNKIYTALSNHYPCIIYTDDSDVYTDELVVIGISVDFDANKISERDFISIDPYNGKPVVLSSKRYLSKNDNLVSTDGSTSYDYSFKYFKNS